MELLMNENLDLNIIKRCSPHLSKGAVYAKGFDRNFKNFHGKAVFGKDKANWMDDLIPITT